MKEERQLISELDEMDLITIARAYDYLNGEQFQPDPNNPHACVIVELLAHVEKQRKKIDELNCQIQNHDGPF